MSSVDCLYRVFFFLLFEVFSIIGFAVHSHSSSLFVSLGVFEPGGILEPGSPRLVSDSLYAVNKGGTLGGFRTGFKKKQGGGATNMHSVFDALPFLPTCISSPKMLNT